MSTEIWLGYCFGIITCIALVRISNYLDARKERIRREREDHV